MDDLLLEKLTSTQAPPNEESNLHSLLSKSIHPFVDSIEALKNGSLVAVKRGSPGKCSLMLDAHIDEVFAVVTGITDDGFLRFHSDSCDQKIFPGLKVIVHGNEQISGVIGVKPFHLINEEEAKKAFEIKDLFIDCGRSKDEVVNLVPVGSSVTFVPHYTKLSGNVSAKSLDDRVAVYIIIELMKRLSRIKPVVNIICHFASQEEATGLGATTSTYKLKPDFAIAIDVTHATSPNVSTNIAPELGKGPVIFLGPTMDRLMVKKLSDVAAKYNIPLQKEVGIFSGTDATDIQVVGGGVPVAVLGIPLRYMHSPNEVVNPNDVEQTINLLYLFVTEIDEDYMEAIHGEH
ncbi:MAG: M20/M25/M40 family metallo-hydrolase [Caldisericaceae bacterium]